MKQNLTPTRDPGLVAIAVFKLFKGVTLIALGLGAFRLLNPVTVHRLVNWLLHFSLTTGQQFIDRAIDMARLGFRTMDEMIGRSDVLRARDLSDHWKARTLDLRALLHRPNVAPTVATRRVRAQDHPIDSVLDRQLIDAAEAALERKRPVKRTFTIRNHDRTVGAMLSGEVAKRYAHAGLPDGTIRFGFTGSAGQSFGAFCARGITLSLEGEANDYLGKGLSGGRLIVVPPKTARYDPAETIVVGNVALYGATSGEAYLHGIVGERFAVRNSGAVAVVEGVGDHGCEYMSAPVFGSAGAPSNGPSQKPCERAKSVRPRPNSTSTASLTPEATSVAVVDPGSKVITLPFCGRWGMGPAWLT